MKKNCSIALIVILLMTTLWGCNVNTNDTTEVNQNTEKTTESEEKVELEESAVLDEAAYIGEYLDENGDANLEIAQNDDGTYTVQIGIFRLTTIDDGVGELTEEGLKFTATDAAGNLIGGIITVEDKIATVTFTDSTWEYLPSGTACQYTKSSDTPVLWEVY